MLKQLEHFINSKTKFMRTVFTLVLLAVWLYSGAQQKPQEVNKWNTNQVMSVNYDQGQILSALKVSKDGLIELAELPEQVLITIPRDGLDKVNLQFNKTGAENTFTVSSGCTGKNCEPFSLTDLNNGVLALQFYKGQLIKVGNHSINPREVAAKNPYIKIAEVSASVKPQGKPTGLLTTEVKQRYIGEVPAKNLKDDIECFTCKLQLPSLYCCVAGDAVVMQSPGKNDNGKSANGSSSTSDKNSAKGPYTYIDTIDAVTGASKWIRQSGDNPGEEMKLQDVRPEANSQLIIVVKGIDTVDYEMSLNGESFFLENEKDFKKAMGAESSDTAIKAIPKPDTVKAEKDSSQAPEQHEQGSVSKEKKFKSKLLALDKVLESFNAKYASIDFLQAQYASDLLQLQENIKCCLQITLGDDVAMDEAVRLYIKHNLDSAYYSEFDQMVVNVIKQYKLALNKTTHRKLFILSKQVPDEDRVKLSIKPVKKDAKLIDYNLWVKGGYKIDFSSGIFLTGIKSTEYVLQEFNFAYRESRDSVVVNNGVAKDTLLYTGRVNSTSGNFIARNENKVSYMAGFFAHVYRRSGRAFNWGGGLGFSINTNGQPYVMAGLSAMLHSASARRIALLFGVVGGRERTLSGTAQPYEVKQEYLDHDNNSVIYGSIHEVPKFYNTGKDLSVDVYDKFRISYFVGFSFNFGSFTLK
jgi:hypothetical protein